MLGLEEFNYGIRFDFIIVVGGCFYQVWFEESNFFLKVEESYYFGICEVEDCDIFFEFKCFKVDFVLWYVMNGC